MYVLLNYHYWPLMLHLVCIHTRLLIQVKLEKDGWE